MKIIKFNNSEIKNKLDIKDKDIIDLVDLPEGSVIGDPISDRIELDENADISNVKSVYFVIRTQFDRDLFRRTYPNVTIKKSPKDADLIIYDLNRYNWMINSTITKYYAIDDRYLVSANTYSVPHIFQILQWAKMPNPTPWAAEYKDKYKESDTGAEIIKYILDSYSNGSFYRSPITKVYKKDPYTEMLLASRAKFVNVVRIIQNLKRSNEISDLSLDQCLSLLSQITSGNSPIIRTAIDSLLQYDHKKYLPVQTLLLMTNYTNVETSKLKIFKTAYSAFGRYTFDGLASGIDRWIKLVKELYSSGQCDFDLNLTRDLLHSTEFKNEILKKDLKTLFCRNEYIESDIKVSSLGLDVSWDKLSLNKTTSNSRPKPVESHSTLLDIEDFKL